MIACPWCKKSLATLQPTCPTCQADLSLIVEFVEGLDGGLVHAEQLARSGRLADAVWAYLEVLDVDPENLEARRQVGMVATAVRHFDTASAARRTPGKFPWWLNVLWLVLVVLALGLGFLAGQAYTRAESEPSVVSGR